MTERRIVLWLRRVVVLAQKDLKQLLRDTPLLIFVVYVFTLDIYVAGVGMTGELLNAKLMVHDADRSQVSRELIYRFIPPYFDYAGEVAHPAQGLRLLDLGKTMMVLDIPRRFDETLRSGNETAQLQLQVDAGNVVLGYLAPSYVERIVGLFSQEYAQRYRIPQSVSESVPPAVASIDNRIRIAYNANLNGHWFNAVGQWLTMMTVLAVLLPAAAFVREKERGTIEQLLVSPVTPLQIMLSKVLATTLLVVFGSAVSLYAIMQPLIAVPFRGSATLFFTLSALYVFNIAGLGLLMATFVRNQAQVGMLTILISAPMTMLSGTWTAPESMPPWLAELVNWSPLHHFIECSYGIIFRGAGLDVLWPSAAALLGLGGALFGMCVWRFRRQFG
ncbi:MAG TPA: ABC transporter permease [Burkholderiaceae bacterium]|jgi:ABC-2 type transport system permease protein|nr:ABC transporter permease [Burkholderiaceae bacterium]